MSTLAEQVVEQLKTDMDNVYDAGYQKGLKEVGGLDVSKFGIQNEVTGTNIVTLDYVNENEHNVGVKLSSDTVTDFSGVEVTCVSKNMFNYEYASDINNWDITRGNSYIMPIFVGKGGTVTISFKNEMSIGLGFVFGIDVGGVNYTTHTIYHTTQPSMWNIPCTATITDDNGYLRLRIGINENSTWEKFLENARDNLQIELGTKVTDYEPSTRKTYIANADGTVDGITSISPVMNIICDIEGVDITAKYYCVQDVEWHRFWDNFQNYGNRTNYFDSFRFYVNDKIFKPKYDIVPTDSARMFSCGGGDGKYSITELKNVYPSGAIVDFSNSKNISQLFHYNGSIKHIGTINTTSATSLDDFANNATSLVEIEKIILKDDGSQRFNSAFYYTVRLERITFEGVIGLSINFQWSPLLSDESVQNIIDCLADLTGQATQTLTFHTDVKAKLTEEQIATITSKNWTLA